MQHIQQEIAVVRDRELLQIDAREDVKRRVVALAGQAFDLVDGAQGRLALLVEPAAGNDHRTRVFAIGHRGGNGQLRHGVAAKAHGSQLRKPRFDLLARRFRAGHKQPAAAQAADDV